MMGAALERMFGAFRTVKASGAEEREGERLEAAATEAWRASVHAATWSAIAGNTAGLAIQVAFIAVLSVGGVRVASAAASPSARWSRSCSTCSSSSARSTSSPAPSPSTTSARRRSPGSSRPRPCPVEPVSAPAPLPPTRQPARGGRLRGRAVPVCAGPALRARRRQLRRPAGRHDRVRRPVRRRQDHGAVAHRAVLRAGAGAGGRRRPRRAATGRSPSSGPRSATSSRTRRCCPGRCGRTSSSARPTPPTSEVAADAADHPPRRHGRRDCPTG